MYSIVILNDVVVVQIPLASCRLFKTALLAKISLQFHIDRKRESGSKLVPKF